MLLIKPYRLKKLEALQTTPYTLHVKVLTDMLKASFLAEGKLLSSTK